MVQKTRHERRGREEDDKEENEGCWRRTPRARLVVFGIDEGGMGMECEAAQHQKASPQSTNPRCYQSMGLGRSGEGADRETAGACSGKSG